MEIHGTDSLPAGAIFDMDGVLVDSSPFHLQKWVDLLDVQSIPYSPEDLPKQVLGLRNDAILRHFLGAHLTEAEVTRLSEELDKNFRRTIQFHAQPLAGVLPFLEECRKAGLPMVLASAAIAKNVEFILDALGFTPYFPGVVCGDNVSRSKPDPETYLVAADKLGLDPTTCVAFEDSFVGIESAKGAGMRCVAVATSFPIEELRAHSHADLIVQSFEELNLERVKALFG